VSRLGGSATIVRASDYVSTFRGERVEPDLVGVAFSTIHDTAQKRLQQGPEAAFFGMGSKGERFGVGVGSQSVTKPSTMVTTFTSGASWKP